MRGTKLKKDTSFEEAVSFENLMEAARLCQKGVTWKASVQMFEINKLRWVAYMHKDLIDGTYKGKGFNEFWICERGKMRFIQSVHISERTVQKSISNNALKPAVIPALIYDNSASIQNKGTEFALNRLRCHLQRHYRKHGRKGGVLTLDFKNYFGSIDHEKLKKLMRRKIADKRTCGILEQFIDDFKGDKGLGLGSEISQTCAIAYPNEIDHFIKSRLRIKGYGRYMDDSYLIHEDTDYLKYCLEEIKARCKELDITLNEKRVRISRLDRENMVYLKKRIMLTETGKVVIRLSRDKITAQRRKLRKQKARLDAGTLPMDAIRQSYQSWRGHAMKYDSYRTVQSMDALYAELFKGGGK